MKVLEVDLCGKEMNDFLLKNNCLVRPLFGDKNELLFMQLNENKQPVGYAIRKYGLETDKFEVKIFSKELISKILADTRIMEER